MWWPSNHSQTATLRASELQILLAQGNPMKVGIPEDWRPLQIGHAADANNQEIAKSFMPTGRSQDLMVAIAASKSAWVLSMALGNSLLLIQIHP